MNKKKKTPTQFPEEWQLSQRKNAFCEWIIYLSQVNPGSLAAKCGLQVGDLILKIGNTSTEYLQHKEAQASIVESGNRLDLLLQR